MSFLPGCPLPCLAWSQAWLLCGGKTVVLIKAFSVVFDYFSFLFATLTVSLYSKQDDDNLSFTVIIWGDIEAALLEKRSSCAAHAMWISAQVKLVIRTLNDPWCCLWNVAFPERMFWARHHLVVAQERVTSETDGSFSARRESLL